MSVRLPCIISTACAAVLASSASAAIESHTVDTYWSVAEGNQTRYFDLPQFDDHGGSRTLNGVRVDFESDFRLEYLAENLEDFGVAEGDWFVDSVVLMDLWIEGEFTGIMGAGALGQYSANLSANDGVPMEGFDVTEWSYDTHMDGGMTLSPSAHDQFIGDGTTSVGIYPFLSIAITAPPPLFDLYINDHIHEGTLTVAYDFTVVPAAPAFALVPAAFFLARRRRR